MVLATVFLEAVDEGKKVGVVLLARSTIDVSKIQQHLVSLGIGGSKSKPLHFIQSCPEIALEIRVHRFRSSAHSSSKVIADLLLDLLLDLSGQGRAHRLLNA